MQHTIFIIALALLLLYALLIFGFSYAWSKIKTPPNTVLKNPRTQVSIIVPARDEEKHIGTIMLDLIQQDYPPHLIEIIIVDDNSSDNTFLIASKLKNEFNDRSIQILQLQDQPGISAYKKRAINEAIKLSSGELIFTTDADCRLPQKWISQTVAFYLSEGKPGMMVGPVKFQTGNRIFEKLQALEFISLIGTTGASIQAGIPLMCNGANLAYTREAYDKAGGFGSDEKFASGDDVFLMLKIKKSLHENIRFVKSNYATVTSYPQSSLGKLIVQRKRWSSKGIGYRDPALIFISILVFLVNLILAIYLCLSPFFMDAFAMFLVLFTMKSIPDFIFLSQVTSFFRIKNLMWYFLPMQLIYIFYVVFVAVYGNSGKFYWKGRLVR